MTYNVIVDLLDSINEKTGDMVYLDNNATTRVDNAVVEAMMPFFSENYGNPSSAYFLGRKNKRIMEFTSPFCASRGGFSNCINNKETDYLQL